MYGPSNLGTHITVNKPVKQDYSGPEDAKTGMNERIGSTFYNRDDYIQSYEGKFIWNNMHGYGEYQWQPLKYKHEGQFYVNKKEGYGRLSYPSGAYFEGLYRNDQRFGPGVYTDAAGYQDVGIWVASKLIRLSRIFKPDHIISRLAITDEDKIRILRYRQIIHLQKDKIKHVADNLLESLTHLRNYDKSVLERAEELYNPLCRDDRAPSFNKPRYDETFHGHESDQLIIVVLMTDAEIQQKIAAENEKVLDIEDSLIVVVPEIKESKVIHEMHNPGDIQIDDQYIGEISQQDVNVKIIIDQMEEKEPDYCGIKQIDLETMNNTLLLGNHEEQWNIFQSSAITIPQDLPENSDVNFSNDENVKGLSKIEASEEELDDFGKKKIRDLQPTKEVVVTDLMAWNNSPILIELLKHVFKHRNFEKKLSFDISKILAGRRGLFRQEGAHEKAALELLEACSSGFQNTISKLVSRQNLDVDVADSRGNTGILFAAARDRTTVIDTLLNLGANIDSMNDECLTPLSLCVLRLLELIHSVTDWSKAFLPQIIIAKSIVDDDPIVFENFGQWHGRISYESLVQELPKRMDGNQFPSNNESECNSKDFLIKGKPAIGKDAMDTELRIPPSNDRMETQKYIFDMSPIIGTSDSWRTFKNDKTKNKNNKMKVKTTTDKKAKDRNIAFGEAKKIRSKELLGDSEQMEDINNSEVLAKKEKIYATISKLLRRGADPNFAQVPYPVLIMAIFTKMPSFVTELLNHGADPDTTLSKIDHSLTPLLILAVLQPAYEHALTAKALLKAKADPSIRADPEYRSNVIDRLKRDRLSGFIDNSEGITALHLLAIRPDMDVDVNGYLGELIRVICKHGCIKRSDLYQGHSPLSLAILEGNLTAVKAFLETACVNVNEQLGADVGNTMLMLESRILQELLPPDLLQEILELLLEYGGCPFASARVLGEEYNQIEYGRKELIEMSRTAENRLDIKVKEKRKSKGSKSSKLPDTRNFAKSMNFIEKIAKEKLIERIKANFVRDLMDSPVMLLSPEKRSELLKEPIFKDALAWMTGEDIAIVMKAMNYNRGNVRELVRLFVMACVLPHEENFPKMDTLIWNETERIINNVMPLVDPKKQIITVANFKVDRHVGKGKTKTFERNVACRSESYLQDNRFDVCFECLNVHGKVLILCPKCQRVYFCSQECNLKCATQEANLHQCPGESCFQLKTTHSLLHYCNNVLQISKIHTDIENIYAQAKEWIKLEEIAMTIGLDPISYMLRRFKNPKMYIDLEKKAGGYDVEQRVIDKGKKSLKNQDDNPYTTNTPKCGDQNSTDYKKYGGDQLVDENEDQHAHKDDSADEMKDKQLKGSGIIMETEDDKDNIRSNKQKKKGRAFDKEDKKASASDIKSNKERADHLFDIQEDLDTKSKNTNKKGHGSDIDGAAFNNIKSKKGIKKSHENGNDKDEKAASGDMKRKDGKKNRYGRTINEVEGDGENQIKSKKEKKEERIEDDSSDNMRLRKSKKKGSELGNKKDNNNSMFKSKDNHWRSKKGEQRSNDFNKNKDENIKDHLRRKHEARRIKQESKNEIRKKTREGELNALNESHKNNRHYVETNVPEKYLDSLLKVSRSAGKNLDIEMLLMPYVVFVQGDMYFRILPANQYPKLAGNYSLI